MERIPSNIKVKVLDFTKYKEYVLNRLPEEYSDVIDFVDNGPFGLIETKEGSYLIDSFGVGTGQFINNECIAGIFKMQPMFYNGGRASDIMGNIQLTKSVIEQIPIKEVVPLDKFIVRYGATVENNYELWNTYIRPADNVYDCILIRSTKDLEKYGSYLTHEKCICETTIPLCEVEANLCQNFAARHLHCKTCGGINE